MGEDIIQFLSEELNGIKGIEMIHIYTKGKRREINGQGRVELVAIIPRRFTVGVSVRASIKQQFSEK